MIGALHHYILPPGHVQIAFSGGRTSAYMLHQILDANGGLPDRARVVFANTGREMPETLDFVQEIAQRWAVPVTWVEYRNREGAHSFATVSHATASRDGEPLIALMRHFGFPPNRVARFCSHEGKTRTAKRFCVSLGWDRWTVALGIRADEAGRAITGKLKDRYGVWYPLIDDLVSARAVARFWATQPFDLHLPNVRGKSWLGNCDGCFLKSEENRAMLARDYPERAAWWAEQESRFSGTFHQSTSWAELTDFSRRQGDWIFNTEGALCQANDGECT
jgi:3'-phosphoadenosine 5'-phosphosulfate sulfotransferase (PAPS reductase)/FAD synthetase